MILYFWQIKKFCFKLNFKLNRPYVINSRDIYSPTKIPVSIFFASWTILLFELCSSELLGVDETKGLFRLLSGAKWLMRFTDLTRSCWGVRCIVRLGLRGTDPYSGRSSSRGGGGQLPPIKLNRSSYTKNKKVYKLGIIGITSRSRGWKELKPCSKSKFKNLSLFVMLERLKTPKSSS